MSLQKGGGCSYLRFRSSCVPSIVVTYRRVRSDLLSRFIRTNTLSIPLAFGCGAQLKGRGELAVTSH